MKPHPFSLLLTSELGIFWYTVMPFSITMAGDMFSMKINQCFSHLKNIIVIADDIMVV